MTKIKCNLIKEIYRNDTNGYTINIVKIKDSNEEELINEKRIHIVGVMPSLNERLTYEIEGELVEHQKYGLQLNVLKCEVAIPDKKEELIEFLSSKLFPIGEKTATKIVDKFKDKTIEIILNKPEKLRTIPRLSEEKIDRIQKILKNQQVSSETILELSKLGFTTKESSDIVEKYKDKTMDIINENIYLLINDLNFSFKDIDEIAKNKGIELEDENRLKALIIYLINEITFTNGNTFISLEELYIYIKKYANIEIEQLEYILTVLIRENIIKVEYSNYYLKEFYDAEKYICNKLCKLSDLPKRKFPNLKEKIIELENKNNITYDDIQRKAIIESLNNNLTIITGGPGTGKTTIIKAIVSLLQYVYKASTTDIALLAPTGRAAKRMMESTKLPAQTIHKYLMWDKEHDTFSKNEKNPNNEKYIIIDEASMIDTLLMEALLKGIKDKVKLIIVGDYYQLPSVSQGQVLKDLIDSEMLDVIKLNCLYRQTSNSYIPILAQEMKEKNLSNSIYEKTNDYNFIECSQEQITSIILSIIEKAIQKGYDESNIQVLAPMYKTKNGIDNLNKKLQEVFNPSNEKEIKVIINDASYYRGDKILQLANDSELNISNGDIGYIVDIISPNKSTSKKPELIVDFDGNIVTITSDKFINIKHGYAISVHKSQGSEFEMVIIPVTNEFRRMLYNKLLYTAVTRAKKSLILIGSINSFINGVNENYNDTRKTTLKKFIIDRYCNMSIK